MSAAYLSRKREGDPHWGDADGLLFDLSRDPEERVNLRADRPDAFHRLAALAESYAGGLEAQPPIHQKTGRLLPMDPMVAVPSVELSEQDAAALRELGYLSTEGDP